MFNFLNIFRKGITTLDGTRGKKRKFGAPMFEPEVFRKYMYCIEESTCDIVGTFRRPPQCFGTRELCPHSLRPWLCL